MAMFGHSLALALQTHCNLGSDKEHTVTRFEIQVLRCDWGNSRATVELVC